VFLPFLAHALRGLESPGRRALAVNGWVWAGAGSYLLTVVCFVFANKLTGAANAILLQYTSPIYVALLSWPLLKERPRWPDLIALCGCVFGMAWFFAGALTPHGLLGNLLALVSGVGFAALALSLRKVAVAAQGVQNAAWIACASLFAVTLGNTFTALVAFPAVLAHGELDGRSFVILAALGAVQIGFSYVLYSAGAVRIRAVVGIVIVALEPILNPIWVALATGILPAKTSMIGGSIIVLSVVLYAVHQAFHESRMRLHQGRIKNSAGVLFCIVVFFSSPPAARAEAFGSDLAPCDPPSPYPLLSPFARPSPLVALRERQRAEGHAEAERTLAIPPTLPEDGDLRGVAVVAHGLNLRPSRMDALANVLTRAGFYVVRVALAGHGGNDAVFARVTRDRYLSDMRAAVCAAAEVAHEQKVPLVLVAFSLGAAVAQDLVNTPAFPRSPFSAQVLFAPAIAVKPFAHAVRLLSFFPALRLPSLNIENYRAAGGTPIAAYNALFASRGALLASSLNGSRVPTLVFLHPDDELVSFQGTRELMEERTLTSWTLEAVDNSGHSLPRTVNHLIIDEASLSKREWERVSARLLEYLP
jgi:drug/metabolite transporter (DMT)-like permease/esterase/lipase